METKQQNIHELQLTDDENRQIRELLRKYSSIEVETASSSKESFIKWLQDIGKGIIQTIIIEKILHIGLEYDPRRNYFFHYEYN